MNTYSLERKQKDENVEVPVSNVIKQIDHEKALPSLYFGPQHYRDELEEELQLTIFGGVFLATHVHSGSRFAIKVSRINDLKKRNENPYVEIDHLRHIQNLGGHPNIVRYQAHFEVTEAESKYHEGSELWLVMEYIDGVELLTYAFSKGVTEALGRLFLADICASVNFVHECGLAHNDISAENFMVELDPVSKNPLGIKLIDFGFARERTVLTPVAKLRYVSPEKFKGVYDPVGDDTYCVGTTLFLTLTQQVPLAKHIGNDRCQSGPTDTDDYFRLSYSGKVGILLAAMRLRGQTLRGPFSDDLIDLLNGILGPEAKRLSLKAILDHRWMQPG